MLKNFEDIEKHKAKEEGDIKKGMREARRELVEDKKVFLSKVIAFGASAAVYGSCATAGALAVDGEKATRETRQAGSRSSRMTWRR